MGETTGAVLNRPLDVSFNVPFDLSRTAQNADRPPVEGVSDEAFSLYKAVPLPPGSHRYGAAEVTVCESPAPDSPLISLLGESRWCNADDITEIKEARLASRGVAEQIMEGRKQQLRDGDFDAVPNPVDPLTTAGRANEAKTVYGESSEQYAEARHSLVVDCQRLFAEAYRKRTWEYFPRIRQRYDKTTDGYQFMGRQLRDMVRDGITPVAEPEEREYRLAEHVEEDTFVAVRRYGRTILRSLVEQPEAPADAPDSANVHVITISECADWAIAAYERKSKAGYGGYVPENEKLMIRGVDYDAASGDRYQEQLGLSGEYITHDIINEALRLMRINKSDRLLSKREVRSTQAIGSKGVLWVAALLDELASRASGKRIFRGEVIPEDQPKDYASIPQEAAIRQASLRQESEDLADFLMTLEANGVDHWESQGLVQDYVNDKLFHKVKDDPEQARIVFDDKTGDTLQLAAQERAWGNETTARALEAEAQQNAPGAVFCGAGSCGLEAVDMAKAESVGILEKLKVKSGDKVVKDTERPCGNCGKVGGVYYGYNSKKVNKLCTNCGATDFKKTK